MIIQKWDGHFYDPMNPNYHCECRECMPSQKGFDLSRMREFMSSKSFVTINDIQHFAVDTHYQILTANMTDAEFIEWLSTQSVYSIEENLKTILLAKIEQFKNRVDYAVNRMQELKDEIRDERRTLLDVIEDNEKWISKIQSQLKEVAPQITELLRAASSLDASSEKVGRAGGAPSGAPPQDAGS